LSAESVSIRVHPWFNKSVFVRSRGSVVLVALCLVTVIAIALASYIAVCSRAMSLSNRTFQNNLSKQLAEMGIEEALRAFNKNDWSDWSSGGVSVDWNTTTYASSKRAVATITFASVASRFGQTVSNASVKIRVDNYDDAVLDSTWNYAANYRTSDLVGYNGTWYRCVAAHSGQTPNGIANLAYWVPAPVPWQWRTNSSYAPGDVVNYSGTWYRCTQAHTSSSSIPSILPTNVSYWTQVPHIYSTYNSSWYYYLNDVVYYSPLKTWISCTSAGWGGNSWGYAPISWRWDGTNIYTYDDVVYYGGTWYRYINGTSTSGNAVTNTTYWENALSGSMHAWSPSGINYNRGDVVYYSATNRWYRCVQAHKSSSSLTPANTTYWSNAPLFSQAWDSNRQYSASDVVRYSGVWYLSLAGNNYGHPPPTTATSDSYWASTADTSRQWSSTTAYNAGTYRSYGGVWYKCLAANTGKSPNNTTYWTAAWANSFGVTTGAPVIYAEGTVTLGDNTTTKTQIRASISPGTPFPNAVAATSNLTINGGTGTVDSYDSNTGSYGGSNITSSAVLAAGSTLAINATTAVKGYLAWPSPPAGISSGTTINGAYLGDDKSHVSRSPYIPQPDYKSVAGSTVLPYSYPGGGSHRIGTPGATTPSVYTCSGDLYLQNSSDVITINGPVIIKITGSLRTAAGKIVISETGSAEIHFSDRLRIASDPSTGGIDTSQTGGVDNQTSDPKKLLLIRSSTSAASGTHHLSMPSSALSFYGAIYMPDDSLTVSSGVVIYGAISAKNVSFSSEATVHYDTSLRYATFRGVDQPYAVSEWRELTDATELATMP
jgi:hypothetical protein